MIYPESFGKKIKMKFIFQIFSPLNVADSTNPIIKVDEEDEENQTKKLDEIQRKSLQSYLKQKPNANKLDLNRIETKVSSQAIVNSNNKNRINANKQEVTNNVIADSFSLIEKKMLNSRNLMKKNMMIKSKYTIKNRSSLFESNIIGKPNEEVSNITSLRNDQSVRPNFLDEYEYAISQKSIKIKSASKSEENYASGESVNFEDEYVDNKDYDEENYQSEYEYEDYEGGYDEDDKECCGKKCECSKNLKYEDQEYEYEYEYEYEDEQQQHRDERLDYDGCKYDEECNMGENEYDDVNFDESVDSDVNEKNLVGKSPRKSCERILTGKIKLDEEDNDEQSYLDLSSTKVDSKENELDKVKTDTVTNDQTQSFLNNEALPLSQAKDEINVCLKKDGKKIERILEEDEVECEKKAPERDKEADCGKSLENSITCTSF
jgi:hypothetical protein